MKLIKFDLPIDGVKVKNLDELRDHMTLEVIGHFRSGLLVKWLKTRGELSIVDDLNKISANEDRGIFEGICFGLNVAIDKDILDCIFLPAPENTGGNISQHGNVLLANGGVRGAFFLTISTILAKKLLVYPNNILDISVDDVLKIGCNLDRADELLAVLAWLGEILEFVEERYPANSFVFDLTRLRMRICVIYSGIFGAHMSATYGD